MKQIGIHDIAKKARVSRMTVSRALRDHPEVSESTRQRILKIAQEMGYRPNPLVSVWMSRVAGAKINHKTLRLAFISDYRNEATKKGLLHNSGLFEAAQRRARDYGFEIEAYSFFYNGMTPGRLSKILETRSCPGCLIGPMTHIVEEIDFNWNAFSNIAIGYSLVRPNLSRVVSNHYMGMRSLLQLAYAKGLRRIGLVLKTLADDRTNHLWTSSYLGFMWHHTQLEPLPLLVQSTLERQEFVQWFKQNNPDTIIGCDAIVVDWVDELRAEGWQGNCSFMHLDARYCNDNRYFATISAEPVLTTTTAIDALVAQIHRNETGIPEHANLTLVPCEARELPGTTRPPNLQTPG